MINPATGTVVNTVASVGGARGVAYDGKYIYVSRSGVGQLAVINPLTYGTSAVPVGAGPFGVLFDGTNIYVANRVGRDGVQAHPVLIVVAPILPADIADDRGDPIRSVAVNMAVEGGRTLVGIALVAVLAACSSGGDTESGDSVNGSSVGVTETLPGDGDAEPTVTAAADPAESLDLSTVDCAADGIDLEAGWPYTVPDSVTVLATTNDVLRYRLVGVTTNADTTLGDVLDVSFGLYDSSEPTGSDDEVTVEFTADAGTARLDLEQRLHR